MHVLKFLARTLGPLYDRDTIQWQKGMPRMQMPSVKFSLVYFSSLKLNLVRL